VTANNAAPGADDADSEQAGRIVVLNGPPRSGKSSIADVIQATFDGPWLNLGADVFSQFVTPPRLRPGIGLRPGGGERPDIEELIPALYAAFYDSVAAHKRRNTGQPGREGRYRTSGPAARSPSRCAAGSGRSTSPASTTWRSTPPPSPPRPRPR
jgi:hypothetical protein